MTPKESPQTQTICIAERQGIGCEADEAQQQCQELLDTLRHQSRFALKIHDEHIPMAHSSALRVQMGGLRGLYAALYPDGSNPTMIANIFELVSDAKDRFGDFARLPFQVIIQHIAAYKGRRGR